MNVKELPRLFVRLVSIPSPSGEEKAVAEFIENFIGKLGWRVWRDAAGKRNNSTTGNLYAYLDSGCRQSILFVAHMDTVQQPEERVSVRFDGEVFRSNGKTILGADDKAGIAAMLFSAAIFQKKNLHYNLLFIFTTREEQGVMGSSLVEIPKSIRVKYVFNIDHTDVPGVFVTKSLGFQTFIIDVLGKAAHAAMNPEQGVNAIVVASEIIQSLPIGRNVQSGSTMNIGIIHGGARTNVICDQVDLKGELRGFSVSTMHNLRLKIVSVCKQLEKEHRAKVRVVFDRADTVPPLEEIQGQLIRTACLSACRSIGIKAHFVSTFSTSDANQFSSRGYQVISVARGGADVHSTKESIHLHHVLQTAELIRQLVSSGDT